RLSGKAFLWADVFQAMDSIQNKPDLLCQLLTFMKKHGLSPGEPIEPAKMRGFVQSKGFLATLEHCANKLNNDFEWNFFPQRYLCDDGRAVNSKWGRMAIEFATPA